MATRALIVGGTNGIGYGIACRLAAASTSSKIFISGRTKPQELPHANMEFRRLDASSMAQIKQYTDAFKASLSERLDYLIMTQGILSLDGRSETTEGIDRKMALHYYGKALLLRELLPVLKEDAKVLVVYDGVRGDPSKLIWDDLDLKNNYGLGTAANHCMCMNDAILQYYATQQKDQGLRRHFMHAVPGIVSTNIASGLPWYLRPVMAGTMGLFAISPDTCAKRLLTGANECAKAGEQEGRFWSNMDGRGRIVKAKSAWEATDIQRVVDHTWTLVDGAINRPPQQKS